jgi:prephenate dehydratase
MIRIGYMGIPFSNSEEAAEMFALRQGWSSFEMVALMSAAGVVDSLLKRRIDYGVVATRNINAGEVVETRDALKGKDSVVSIDAIDLPIHHCLFVKRKDARITVLASHVQALLQTRDNLDRLYPSASKTEVEDTAYAAELLAQEKLPETVAVVCRRNAGEHYGLVLLHEDIEDNKDNMTSFALLESV